MNVTMPSRDRSHRKGTSCRLAGSARVVLGVEGLDRIAPPGCSPAARRGRGGRKSGFDRVGPLPVLSFGGCHCHPHLLPDGARQEAAHGMGLPACRFHQFLHAGSLGAFQQFQHFRCLAAVAGRARLSAVFGCFLGCLGLWSLLGRNVGALSGNTSLFAGFRPLGPSHMGRAVFGSQCGHVVSFGGSYRDHINHSDRPHKQVNSAGTELGLEIGIKAGWNSWRNLR
jgi:hypothetical protein